MIQRRTLIVAALLACLAVTPAFAEDETPIVPDSARPAVGEWIGHVSWNDPIVSYTWAIEPDGTFTSGRAGRGHGGGGEWGVNGTRVTLKYDSGFRYEGELRDDNYAGTARRADGRAQGTFSMWRAAKHAQRADDG